MTHMWVQQIQQLIYKKKKKKRCMEDVQKMYV